jgi:hypothetical protein
VSHRSPRPRQVYPAGRAVRPLNTTGAESNLTNMRLVSILLAGDGVPGDLRLCRPQPAAQHQ